MFRYIVDSNTWLTPDTMLLSLRRNPNERKTYHYLPGQYAAISYLRARGPSYARCFSITSTPTDLDVLQFSIRVNGRFTRRLNAVQPGSEIHVRGPFGGFVVDPTKERELVLIAGGIGIAPFMSMIRYLQTTGYPHDIQLLYGVQNQDNIPFIEELIARERTMPNLHVTYCVSHGETSRLVGCHVVQGRVDAAEIQSAIDLRPSDKTLFICGPPSFMKNMVRLAKIHGMRSGDIITEAFNQGSHRQTGKVISWPRNMYILGGLSVAFGAFAIMVSDIIKNLPQTPLTDEGSAQSQLGVAEGRERDLDDLIKGFLSNLDDDRSESPAVTQATKDAAAAKTPTSTTPTAKTTTTPTSTTSTTSTPSPTPTPTPTTPTTPAKPTPVCTTSASGVTTCK